MKKIFTTDLDGTVVYSQNHTFTADKTLVETHKDYTAYMNTKLYDNLTEYNEKVPFIPVTTRALEEYQRIQFPIVPSYALVLNGAVLLKDGVVDESWTEASRNLIRNEVDELDRAQALIDAMNIKGQYPTIMSRQRDGFFIFVKTNYVSETIQLLKEHLDMSKVDVYNKKSKIYVIPKSLSKGVAVKRLKRLLEVDYVIAAGDSDIDKPMLVAADEIILCDDLKEKGVYIYE